MLTILTQYLAYIFSVAIVLFLPGYCLALALSSRKKLFTGLETFVLSLGFSIIVVDFLTLALGALKIAITRSSLLSAIAIFSAICLIAYFLLSRKHVRVDLPQEFFSKKQLLSVVLILSLSFFIRTIYLSAAIAPSATDLGHHMYWANTIVKNGAIPNFQQRDIAVNGADYSITPPHNISDFIIGEHLIFADISLLSGISVISFFPIVTLLLIDIFSILAIFIFALRLFAENREKSANIAIMTLLLLGPVFAITPPQAKFVGGGVIGNVIGNLLIPLALYFYVRAIKEKNSTFLSLAILFSMALFYTHHLTALIFMLTLAFATLAIFILNIAQLKKFFLDWRRTLFSFPVIGMLFFALLFAFLVYTPTYITNRAVTTVVGGPTKTGHDGLSLTAFKDTLGEPRVAFALMGIALLLLIYLGPKLYALYAEKKLRENFDFTQMLPAIFLLSWLAVICVISIFPTLLHIDIPSGRVANYGTYPFAIIAAYALIQLIIFFRSETGTLAIKKSFVFASGLLLFSYVFSAGYFDNNQNLALLATPQKVQETFHASKYLSENISPADNVLSDHINLTADAWIKIFFMKDYHFPFYRANLDRYDNGIDRKEKCTLNMLASPSSADSKKCFTDLGINYVIVNKKTDASQFKKDISFSLIYSNDDVNVYYKPLNLQLK